MPLRLNGTGISGVMLEDWMTTSVLAVCRQRPGAIDALRRNFGGSIPNLSESTVGGSRSTTDRRRLCVHAIQILWNEVNQARGKDVVRASDWRVTLYAVSGARTIREAIHCWSMCCEASDGRCGRVQLCVRNGQAEVHLEQLGSRQTIETALILLYSVAEFHSLLQWLISEPLQLSRICLGHDSGIFSGFGPPPLPVPIEMGASWTGFAFPELFLDYPADWKAESVMDRPDGNFLFSNDTGQLKQDLAERVRRIAIRGLRERQLAPRLGEIAGEVGMSVATLRRRLLQQNASYRQIKDSCRRELGLKMLRHSDLPIEEIASRLDFGDSDTFRRAFRSWMGTSPSRFRNDFVARGGALARDGGKHVDP